MENILKMKIHNEGKASITTVIIFALIAAFAMHYFWSPLTVWHFILDAGLLVLVSVVLQFFKYSPKVVSNQHGKLISPASGKIVVIEEVENNEYMEGKHIQISIFMSVWNVHLNRAPISGNVLLRKYIHGKHLLARLPKSSSENEQCVYIIESPQQKKILVKQIAGIMARRIVSYVHTNQPINQGDDIGFIKFGSRVDILIPVGSTIHVTLGQKVVSGQSLIATL